MKLITFFLPFVFVLTACDGGSTRDSALYTRITALEQANSDLKSELQTIKLQLEISEWDKFAFMKPGDEGYSALRFDLGVVTVKITDVKAYANGSKITLNFGNLTSARIDGLKAKLDWGKVDAKGTPQNDATKTRVVVFNDPLPAGAWTNSDVVLEGIPPTELGFVRLHEVGHRGIGLRR